MKALKTYVQSLSFWAFVTSNTANKTLEIYPFIFQLPD